MDEQQTSSGTSTQDEVYLRIWQMEQEHGRHRWTLTTFFIGISFAILGFSFQGKLSPTAIIAFRLCGLLVYWFACLLFLQLYAYGKFLRMRLREMETSGHTTLDLQGQAEKALRSGLWKRLSATRLLLYFGVLYAAVIVLLGILGL
jgi:hypothetical protein